jgi:SNF2 family DNA or RNA helicase
MSSNLSDITPGEVIRNRNRLWRVDRVKGNTVTATAIDGTAEDKHEFYAPIESIEEGNLEPPSFDRIGSPQFQNLLIQANRLSMLHGTAPLISLQRSRVIPTEYQLSPVVMALDSPRVRLLLADDVGLGKTIEAGLITSELLARNRADRVLVITPANLREQWKDALNHFFHVDADIISRRHRRQMEKEIPPGTSPWEHFSKLIVSIDYAKKDDIRNEILEQDWDLVIVDEAHKIAKPHESTPNQSISMQRWEFGKQITDHAEHCLLLTATPHNGYTDSFASLLRMLDVGAVEGPRHDPKIRKEVANGHVVQRRRKDVQKWFGEEDENPFPERDQKEIKVDPTDYEKRTFDAVRDYGDLLMSMAEQKSDASAVTRWAVIHFLKRALSSPAALRESLKNRIEKLDDRLEELEEVEEELEDETAGVSETMAKANALDDDPGEEYTEEELRERVERFVTGDKEAIQKEIEHLEEALGKAERVTKTRDSKLQKLLNDTLPSRFAYPRVIIFTKYVDTLNYLEEMIEDDDDLRTDVYTLHGSLNEAQRNERFQKFKDSDRAVLIATDVISEGMNLQRASNQIIHYELPWNPNRLEQRNGRVDRYGQLEDKVFIRTMVMRDEMDLAVLNTLVKKARTIRQDYGFSPPYFGDNEDILSLMEEEGFEVGTSQTSIVEFNDGAERQTDRDKDVFDEETLEKIQSESFYGHGDVDLDDVQKRQEETHKRVGGPETLKEFVKSALGLFDASIEMNVDETYTIEISDKKILGPSTDVNPEYERVTFDPEMATESNDIEMVDAAHPLVQRLIEAVKEVSMADEDRYGRTAIKGTEVAEEPTAVYTVLARYVANTEDPTIMEEMLTVGLPVYGDSPLSEEKINEIEESEAKPVQRTSQEKENDLKAAIEHDSLEAEVEDRSQAKCEEVKKQRREMKERLKESDESGWLEGIDDVEVASTDILTVTLYYPA